VIISIARNAILRRKANAQLAMRKQIKGIAKILIARNAKELKDE